ncbi:MAG: dicarboxylate/amino acid:cation symporter [Flavobacteriaceae bacterium]|nr:dicarboxylate/amino acid:cation symporter [Flavobacteriaceae bacterium]
MRLHWKILIGLGLGILFGIFMTLISWGPQLVVDYIKPLGTIFINLLKLMAIPIILASLIHGISNLPDLSELKVLGFKTIGIFMATTFFAVLVGVLLVNIIQPGNSLNPETHENLMELYAVDAAPDEEMMARHQERGPLQFVVDIFPENIFSATTDNRRMLQVIFFAILFGAALFLIPKEKSRPLREFFSSFNDVGMKMIEFVMLVAPYGVFALMAAIVIEAPSLELFGALGLYGLTTVLGLIILIGTDTLWVRLFGGRSPGFFLKGIAPAQLVAFSASSSAATLPVTLERTKTKLKVPEHVRSFVLPIGATVNMDGTCLYQGVTAIFIAQVFGIDLSLSAQIGIILTATLASIGTAPVPGAGFITLVIVLSQAGIPEAGLALVLALERPLNMCRTAKNITGDAMTAVVVNNSLKHKESKTIT